MVYFLLKVLVCVVDRGEQNADSAYFMSSGPGSIGGLVKISSTIP